MADNENEEILREKEAKKKSRQKRSIVQVSIGLIIMLAGVGIILYPYYRQKKADDLTQQAIELILSPQPQPSKAPQGDGTDPNGAGEVTGEVDTEGNGTVLPGGSEVLDPEDWANSQLPEIDPDKVLSGEEDQGNTNTNRLNGQELVGVIQIPKIELIYAIVEGTETAEIGVAIGHMKGTKKIGAKGNCVLAGHRGGYSGPYFKYLNKLVPGDEVILTNKNSEQFVYKVTESFFVQPTEMWVTENTGKDKAVLTLITCENDGKERLIVRCAIEEPEQ